MLDRHSSRRLLLVLLSVLPLVARGAAPDAAGLARQVDALLRSDTPRPFSGVVLIRQGSKTLYRSARGFADAKKTTPLTPESQFIIGSLSKQMTATLVLREVEAGRLQLDATLATLLPDLPATWKDRVAVSHLLNHTAGIEAVSRPLKSNPGEAFVYSDVGYSLLGRIVEKTSGKSFTTLAEALFERCDMRHTRAPPSGAPTALRQRFPQLAAGFTEQEDGSLSLEEQPRDAAFNPAGGILSTAGDLARWNDCLHGGRVLKAETWKTLVTPAPSAHREHRWGRLGYGHGIQVSNQDGILELSHSGYVPGYVSVLFHYPERKLTVVVLENTAWRTASPERAFHVHDALRSAVRALQFFN